MARRNLSPSWMASERASRSWKGLLLDVKARSLTLPPKLAIVDGALETVSKIILNDQATHAGHLQVVERSMDCGKLIVTTFQTASLPHPSQRTLDNPANLAQATAMRPPRLRQMILDMPSFQALVIARRAVGGVSVEALGTAAFVVVRLGERRDGVEQRQGFQRVVALGPGDSDGQRSSLAIDEQVPFRPFFGPIRGVLAGKSPPKTARGLWLSTTPLDQSISPSRPSSANRAWSNFFQTPRRCHVRSRRQHVTPEPHPISWGSIHQGMPLWSTKMIPVRQARSSTGGRPRLPGRALCFGSRGATKLHNSSETKGRPIAHLQVAQEPLGIVRGAIFETVS